MADIHQLTTTVVDREREKLNQAYDAFKQTTKDQMKQQKESTQQEFVNRKLTAERQLKQEFEKAKNSLANKGRDLNLQVKQSVMTQYIQDVKQAMEQLDAQTVAEFIQAVVQQLEAQTQAGHYELILGEKTSQLLGNQLELPIDRLDETIAGQAGFVIRHGSIEYNYLFDKLVEDNIQALQALIVKEVFPTN